MDQRAQGEVGIITPSSPKPLLINLVPSVFQADPGRDPFMALDLSVSWASQKNWQKIKLESSIRVGLKITEIEVSFHHLQRASDIQEFQQKLHFKKHVQRYHSAPGYSSALTRAGKPLQTLTQAEGLHQGHFWQHLPLGEPQKREIQWCAVRSDLILTCTPLHFSSKSPFYVAQPKEYFKRSSQLFCCSSDVF